MHFVGFYTLLTNENSNQQQHPRGVYQICFLILLQNQSIFDPGAYFLACVGAESL
jgi:hypothetical protein